MFYVNVCIQKCTRSLIYMLEGGRHGGIYVFTLIHFEGREGEGDIQGVPRNMTVCK